MEEKQNSDDDHDDVSERPARKSLLLLLFHILSLELFVLLCASAAIFFLSYRFLLGAREFRRGGPENRARRRDGRSSKSGPI